MLNLNYEPNVLVEDTESLTREEWLAWRKVGLGGSDVGVALGVSPFQTRRDLYYDKVGFTPAISDEENNETQKEVGKLLEPVVAKLYQKKYGYKVYPIRRLLQHPFYPILIANVDYFVEKPDGTRGVLECKTSHYENRYNWFDGRVPYHYELQGRHYMSVANVDFSAVACLFSNSADDFFDREFPRDLEQEEDTILQLLHFWKNHIEANVEPPYAEKPDLALESIRRFHGAADESLPEVTLSPALATNLREYLQLKEQKSSLEKDSRELDKEMKRLYVPIVDAMGPTVSAVCVAGSERYVISYKPSSRVSIKKDALVKMQTTHPDVYDLYATTSDSRSFSVKMESA